MSVIRVLPDNVSNKIAAGEVIERPASVVKELVENSLDAGASRITVNIEQGGLRLIAITDDGCGMDGDDALLCFEPHATSKIFTDHDISRIVTFGFRGEAMPSVASVSRVTLRTRRHDDVAGTEVVLHGGKHIGVGPAGCAPGTEISVRDIFFNTPARKKFLRSRSTEEAHIEEAVMMLSLPHPHVAFELIMDGRRVFHSPAHEDLLPRLRTYYGREMAEQLIAIDYQSEAVKINGYIARHGFTRTTRREQRVFVNGRPVEALPVYNGIRDGYGSLVEKGRYAPVVLFVHVDPMSIDVNVHPAKREIRFRQPRLITQAVMATVLEGLKTSSAPTVSVDPALSLRAVLDGAGIEYQARHEELAFDFPDEVPLPNLPLRPRTAVVPQSVVGPVAAPGETVVPRQAVNVVPGESLDPAHEPEREPLPDVGAPVRCAEPLAVLGKVRLLGIVGDLYLVAEVDNGLLLIDQHAAHERVIYERLLKEAGEGAVQRLLLPLTVDLARSEVLLLEKHRRTMEQLGFDLEPVGDTTVLVNAMPAAIGQNNAGGIIRDLVLELRDDERVSRDNGSALIARAACRAAVKAHDSLNETEALALLNQMGECELPFSCPHGRPTILNISYRELERRFGRR